MKSEPHGVSGPRRGLRRHEAANYLGVSASLFDQLVIEGKMPRPVKLRSCSVWDMRQLDVSFEAMSGETVNTWDAAIEDMQMARAA